MGDFSCRYFSPLPLATSLVVFNHQPLPFSRLLLHWFCHCILTSSLILSVNPILFPLLVRSVFVRWVQQSGNTKSHYSISFTPTGERVEYFRKVVEGCHHREQWGRITLFNTHTHTLFLNDKITRPQLTLRIKEVSTFGFSVNNCFCLAYIFADMFPSEDSNSVVCTAFPFLSTRVFIGVFFLCLLSQNKSNWSSHPCPEKTTTKGFGKG